MSLEEQLYRARVLRLTAGIGLSAAAAFGLGWTFSFLTPMLVASFLTTPAPRPKVLVLLAMPLMILGAFLLTLLVSMVGLTAPIIAVPALGLLIFRCFYKLARGVQRMWTVWMLIGTLLIPVMSLVSMEMALGITLAIFKSGIVAMAFVWLAHALVPDPVAPRQAAKQTPTKGANPSLAAAAKFAFVRTMVVLPLELYIVFTEGTDQLKILIFTAILSLSPNMEAGARAGKGLIVTNLAAGAVAIILYEMLTMCPAYPFLILCFILLSLVCARQIFGGGKFGKVCASGFGTVILLIGLGTMPIGDETGGQFYTRIFHLMLAAVYVILAFRVVSMVTNWLTERTERKRATAAA